MPRKIVIQKNWSPIKSGEGSNYLRYPTYRVVRRVKNIHGNKINFTINETSQLLNMSYDFIREKIKSNKIIASRYGDRYMINIFEVSRILVDGVD